MEMKDDIESMLRYCESELNSMQVYGLVAAPYCFERVAILARKQKNYWLEVSICEKYINAINSYYTKMEGRYPLADVRKGPRYKAIVKRLPKAKTLLAKQNMQNNE